jgi:hypothetical protein
LISDVVMIEEVVPVREVAMENGCVVYVRWGIIIGIENWCAGVAFDLSWP